jgi:hypothetical protein
MAEPTTDPFEDELNAAFDEFLSAGLAPWLVARTGAGLPSAPSGEAKLPENALDVPRLEGDAVADLLVGRHFSHWFRPEFAVATEFDPVFIFAVNQTGDVGNDGPFNRATLRLSLRTVMPANVAEIAQGNTGLVFRRVPDLNLGVTLSVPMTTRNGATEIQAVPGTATAGADGGFVATFNLTGSVVTAAYVHLTRRGEAGLDVTATYTGYQTGLVTFPDVGFPVHGPIFRGCQFKLFGDGSTTPTPDEPVDPPGAYRFFPVTARFTRAVRMGLAFDTDAYRSRFTITAENTTRPIIDANDLDDFAAPRSEYRELTTLGDVAAKYPSLRRLYFGQVSGTVVAVPAAYGILRTAQGLLASCDSIVDDSPVTITGCRFHLTFTISPMADPIDLAQLRADILAIPEAAGRMLRVALPGGLDPRHPSSLDGFPAGQAVFSDSQEPAVQVGVDIADDRSTPATTNVNLFLQQLASTGPAPLFGNIAVRLDDAFPEPVRTQLMLTLRQTADRDELEIAVLAGPPPAVQATNRGPHDLVLRRFATVQGHQVAITTLGDQVLPAGRSTILPGVVEGVTVEVSRSLAVPSPLPKAAMSKYLTFHTHTVQEVQHPLTVNAAGLNFAAAGITAIDIHISMTATPGTSVPAMTLSPSHPIDFVHVLVPVDSVVTGLDCTVVLTLTTAAGGRTATVSHDFVGEPILIVTQSTIA